MGPVAPRTASRGLAALVAGSALLFVASCARGSAASRTLRYGLTLAPTGIDPHLNASAELGIPLSSVYDTLVYLDPTTGEFVPGLAESWTLSGDGRTYTFRLRQDVTFHDGEPFNAEAVRANIEYILDPDHHSQKAIFMLGPLRGVEVLDTYTVAFSLHEPFAPLLDSLAQVYLGMASPSALTAWGPTEYQFHQVGTGPFRFVEYVPNDHLTLERNPDYAWPPSFLAHANPGVDTIIFTFYEDPATRALALESGEIDVIGEVPPRDASRLAGDTSFSVYPVPIPGQPLQYLFNTALPPTDELQVRRALILGVDRAQVVRTVFGEYSPVAQGPLSAVTWGFTPAPSPLDYDPQAAQRLLEDAGWVDADGDGRRERDGIPLRLHLVAPTWGSNPDVSQLLQAAWVSLGAEVDIEVVPGFGALKEAQAAGGYHLIGLNFFGTDPDLVRPMFASDGLYAWTGYADTRLDALLLAASQESLDPSRRLALYAEFAQHVQDQALVLPIRDYVNLVVASTRLEGLRFSPQGWFPLLSDLSLES